MSKLITMKLFYANSSGKKIPMELPGAKDEYTREDTDASALGILKEDIFLFKNEPLTLYEDARKLKDTPWRGITEEEKAAEAKADAEEAARRKLNPLTSSAPNPLEPPAPPTLDANSKI